MNGAVPVFLVLGGKGMLGRAFRAALEYNALPYRSCDVDEVDISSPDSLRAAIYPGVRFVLNCAAWTNVDGAEKEEAAATKINGHAVKLLAERCAEAGALLVTYSTDYVFDGQASSPYRTGQKRAPLNAYGRSKAVGEEFLEQSAGRWLNIRTSWLYAPWGNNFVRTIAKLLREKPSIKVVNDQRGRPTSAEHLAAATLAMIDAGALGHQHVTDGGECTWYEFAGEIGRLTGAPGRVAPCTSAEFPRPAKRPAYSVLDLSGTETLIGPMPDWKANLTQVARRLEA
jgi:dTDP-4-dehydrorhamnose reductase